MHSPISLKGSQSVKIVVLCAQTRLPGPRDRRDAFSSLSEEHISTGLLSRPLSLERRERGLYYTVSSSIAAALGLQ